MKRIFPFYMLITCILTVASCTDVTAETKTVDLWQGKYTHDYVSCLTGFPDYKDSLLAARNVTKADFIRLTTDSAWALSKKDQSVLLELRYGVKTPTDSTLLCKTIPLSDVAVYVENRFGGTVGGYVCVAADVKELRTLEQVYYGIRLDYPGSPFKADGTGYAVIRFYSSHTDRLSIPLCSELGGNEKHRWPNTGGGFTASKLGNGGYPEYEFTDYFAPNEGAELYEMTATGYETLRSVFHDGKWQTYEPETK